MSVVVGVIKNGVAAIGADTLTTWGYFKQGHEYLGTKKILQVSGAYLGITGSAAFGHNIIPHYLRGRAKAMSFSSSAAIFDSMLKLHNALKKDYYVDTHDSDNDADFEVTRFTLLVVSRAGLFEVSETRSVLEHKKFCAIGQGDELAVGAMYAVYDSLNDPKEIALAGLRAAAEFCRSCAAPFHVHTVKLTRAPKTKKTREDGLVE